MLNFQRVPAENSNQIQVGSYRCNVLPRASSRPSGGSGLQKKSLAGTDWNQSTMHTGYLSIYEML